MQKPETKSLVPFVYESMQIRASRKPDGTIIFVAKDVCDALDHTNTSMAMQMLDDDERSKESLGRQGDTWFVTESGLYTLILRSNKPEAKPFRKWVTSEVLPAIRRNGSYSIEAKKPEADIEAGRREGMFRGLVMADIFASYPKATLARVVRFRKMGLSRKETGAAVGLGADKITALEDRLRQIGFVFEPVNMMKRNKEYIDSLFHDFLQYAAADDHPTQLRLAL